MALNTSNIKFVDSCSVHNEQNVQNKNLYKVKNKNIQFCDPVNLYAYQDINTSKITFIGMMKASFANVCRKILNDNERLLVINDNPVSREKIDKILLKNQTQSCPLLQKIQCENTNPIDPVYNGIMPSVPSTTFGNKNNDTLNDLLFDPTPHKGWYCVVQGQKITVLGQLTYSDADYVAQKLGYECVYSFDPICPEVEFKTGDGKSFDSLEEFKLLYDSELKNSKNTKKRRKRKVNKGYNNIKRVPDQSAIGYVHRYDLRCAILDRVRIADESGLEINRAQLANELGTSPSTIYRVQKIYNDTEGKATYDDLGEFKRGRKPNQFAKIPEEIFNHLVNLFQDKTPLDKDIKGYTWRASEVVRYLEQLGIHVSLPYFYKFCQKVGFTSKVATRKNPKQNDSYIDYFTTEGFLKIARIAVKENREIVFMDQAGIMVDHHNLRGYSLCGTPTMGGFSTELGHVVASTCTFIGLNGFFRVFCIEGTITSEDVIDMIEIVKKENRGKKFIFIIDNARIHTSKKFLYWYFNKQRFCLAYYIPPYAPKLNVVEFFNNIFKQELRDVAVLDNHELVERARAICKQFNSKTPDRMKKVKSLFLKKECRYAKEIYSQVYAAFELKNANEA